MTSLRININIYMFTNHYTFASPRTFPSPIVLFFIFYFEMRPIDIFLLFISPY